jgi:hypothetical protein
VEACANQRRVNALASLITGGDGLKPFTIERRPTFLERTKID